MVRGLKKSEERKNEILDVAEELFRTKGYEATTTTDILNKAGIARGTLYNYFRSKDDVLNAVIDRSIDRGVEQLYQIVKNTELSAVEKLQVIVLQGFKNPEGHEEFLDYLHENGNEVMHLRILVQSIKKISPVIAEIIQQGVEEGTFETEHSLELSEFIMVVSNFLFDESLFPLNKKEYIKKINALEDMMETSLRVKKGTLGFMSSIAHETLNG